MHAPRHVRALLFDMDNTLFDLVGAKYAACRVITREMKAGSPAQLFSYFLRRTRGFEDPENIRDFLVDAGVFTEEAYQWCAVTYHDVKLGHIEPYCGVEETLAELAGRGHPMAIVTDAHRMDAIPRLEKAGVCGMFDQIVTWDLTWEKKPSPVPFLYALEKLGTDPAEAILVGDSPRRDIAPGRDLGMTTVYARYGDRFRTWQGDGGAHFAIDEFRQLIPLLDTINGCNERREPECAAGSLLP